MAEREAAVSRGDTAISKDSESEVQSIIRALALERIDQDLYRAADHWNLSHWNIFGGQLVGQALLAATTSVDDNLHPHSLHCYFLRKGKLDAPVLYQVGRTTDGHSSAGRSVKVVQHGQPIMICQALFGKWQPTRLQHQFTMPVVPPPEDLLSVEELICLQPAGSDDVSENAKQAHDKHLAEHFPLERKPVHPKCSFDPEPRKLYWLRAKEHIGEGNMKLHFCAAAFLSDVSFLDTVVLPYADYKFQKMVSLDHAMWFHNTFCCNEWMLYECESPWAGKGRGLVQGRLWRRDGVLAVSCCQEGAIKATPNHDTSKL